MTHVFHPTMLREYDIRGVVGDTLSDKDAYAIGRGFATLIARAGGTRVTVGYDGRLSSPMLADALIEGIKRGGRRCAECRARADPDALLCRVNRGCGTAAYR
jgi:phosphomannomutase